MAFLRLCSGAICAAAVLPPAAEAQDQAGALQPAGPAENPADPGFNPAPAPAAAPVERVEIPALPATPLWTATASAGIAARRGGPDGSWQSLALARRVGNGYVRGTVMRYHGTLVQSDAALPSDYVVGTVGAGGNFNNWVADGWASVGQQDYGRISTSAGTRASTGAKSSGYYAFGGDFGRIVPIGNRWYITPTVAVSYAHGKLLRPAPTGSEGIDLETREPTWSASTAVRIDHAFGRMADHYAGVMVSRNWTSNGVSELVLELPEDGFAALPTHLQSRHQADGWTELGVTANMRLTGTLHLDLFATRGFGAKAGNTTSAGVSLRKSF